ncbi:MAG TPA: tRNA pseudouridine(13) synthase TruD, partial [Kofleriaceae bacterium]|nr:tRNA pseudouridine(13) synthase TruD [Kofleriaceae bacterium]
MSLPVPYFTADLPGTGGALRAAAADFEVEEIPAYAPAGEGSHVFAWIEKRGLTTLQAMRALAGAVGVSERDVGSAGMKDRHAVTRQFLSFPPPVTPDALFAARVDGVTVLSAVRHPHKLRTGHLRGNRFRLAVRGLAVTADAAAERAAGILARLAEPPGAPNWYGEQRFGARGDNAAAGRALLSSRRRGGREARLLVSAYQSELFNRYLEARIGDGLYRRVIDGDILVVASGGMFATSEPAVDELRLARGEVIPTGPMFGHSMRAPAAGSQAAAREEALLAAEGITSADFKPLGPLAPGTRRPIAVAIAAAAAVPIAADAIQVAFELPAGAYATAVMREITKTAANPPRS